jgi:hypothetical protein
MRDICSGERLRDPPGASPRLSLAVLLMLDVVAHSVINSLRRAVTIGTAAVIFHTHVSLASALGIVLVIGGSLVYALGAAASARPAPADKPAAGSSNSASPASTVVGQEQETIALLEVRESASTARRVAPASSEASPA